MRFEEYYLIERQTFTVYHGSNVPIKKFDRNFSAQGVFWFSEDKDKIKRGESGAVSTKYIITAEITVNKTAGWEEYDKYFLQQLIQQGYDSIHLDENWVVFDAKNIKVVNIEEQK